MDGEQPPLDPNEHAGPPEVEKDEPTQPVSEYLKQVAPYQKDKRRRKLRSIVTIIIIVLLLAVAGWYLLIRPKGSTTDQPQTNNQPSAPAEEPPAETKHHESNALFLGFDYPGNWSIDESKADQLVIASPVITLTDADGQPAKAKIVVLIRQQGAELKELAADNATALKTSEKITYTNPSSVQRGKTYLSFLHFATSNPDSLDAVYITGDNGYEKDGFIPKADFKVLDPIVSVSFYSCNADSCELTTDNRLGIDASQWDNNENLKAAKQILTSLQVS